MSQKIHEYFLKIGIPEKEAWHLHLHYYKNYGLAIRGLQQHHPKFDAEDFDRSCDGALPLEDLLSNDVQLQQLLKDIDRSKVKVMALTNAYKPVRDPECKGSEYAQSTPTPTPTLPARSSSSRHLGRQGSLRRRGVLPISGTRFSG